MQEMMGSYIGWSKLVFMDNQENVAIVNEKSGEWNSDCWFSNKSYIPVVEKPKPQTQHLIPYQFKPKQSYERSFNDDYFDMTENKWTKQVSDTHEIVMGDVFEMDRSHQTDDSLDIILKGCPVEVTGFMQRNTVEVKDRAGRYAIIPVWMLGKKLNKGGFNKLSNFFVGSIGQLIRNFNHFRAGDEVEIVREGEQSYGVRDVTRSHLGDKEYVIPKHALVLDWDCATNTDERYSYA
jgi:hypothetical protein